MPLKSAPTSQCQEFMPRASIVFFGSSARSVPSDRKHLRLPCAFVPCLVTVLMLLCVALASAQSSKSQPHAKASAGSDHASADRGRYIVEGVAMCGQCHTPNDAGGVPDRAHWLQGAPVPFQPSRPAVDWPINAPRIGGTPLPASDADMVKLLTTGIWTTGAQLRPPMPQFRMNRADAEAVVAYLKSVTGHQ
jgi:mono/diheme cytochrome c family protein